MALLVKVHIILAGDLATFTSGNDSHHAGLSELFKEGIGVIAPVSNEVIGDEALNQGRCLCDVMSLTGREQEAEWIPQSVDDDMDLGTESTPASA